MSNPISWFEIACNDLERAKTFYSKVFSAEFEFVEMPDAKMYMFKTDYESYGCSGSLVLSPDNVPSKEGVSIYFHSENVEIETDRVSLAGGMVVLPKTSIGQFGFIALFMDSEGNKIGLHSMS